MRVLAVIENIANEYGGPANSLPNLLEALRQERSIHSIIYSVINSEGEENEFIERFSIPWVRCRKKGAEKVVYSSELKQRLADSASEGDVIYSNNLWNYPAFLSSSVSHKKSLPHVISVRGSLYPWSLSQGRLRKKIAWFVFQKRSLERAELIHVTCRDELEAVRSLGIKTPIALVPHGINYDDYQNLVDKNVAIERLSLKEDKKFILFMSRLHKKKGVDMLLEVWLDIVRDNPDWCLLFAGPDYSNYEGKIAELAFDANASDNVKVLGMLEGEEKKAALAVSNFFVLPSYSENFGIVIGEALAAGLPVVTTTGTPWSEINDRNCGRWIELSKDNLRESIEYMMSLGDAELSTMSVNAKELIKNEYSWSAQAIKFGYAIDYLVTKKVAPNIVYVD